MTIEDATGARPPPTGPPPTDVWSGWWPSPWTAAQVAAGKVSRRGLMADGGTVYRCESRPDQGGHQVVVATDPSDPSDRSDPSGPLPGTEPTYPDRSPINHPGDLVGRVLLLQRLVDPVVPVSQAERFAGELRSGGADCRLVVLDGVAHGFRRAETIEAALTTELDIYRQLFSPGERDGR